MRESRVTQAVFGSLKTRHVGTFWRGFTLYAGSSAKGALTVVKE